MSYKSQSIPQKKQIGKSPYSLRAAESHKQSIQGQTSDDHLFAEIEYVSNPFGPSSDVTEQIYQNSTQVIPTFTDRASDPVRQLFYRMRQISTGNPWNRNDSLIFYKQAVMMADFEDDYEEEYPCSMHYPCYQRMSYEQLRTYFTWRSHTRSGDIRRTSLAYYFLYLYEIVNGIAIDQPEDGAQILYNIWKFVQSFDSTLDRYIPQWIRDYCVYYQTPDTFTTMVKRYQLHAFYPEIFLDEWKNTRYLDLWCRISNYDIRTSKFYTEEYQELIRECVVYVIQRLNEQFQELGLSIEEFLFVPYQRIGAYSEQLKWIPFAGALFVEKERDAYDSDNRDVIDAGEDELEIQLSKYQIYRRINQSWYYQSVILLDNGRKIAGYILKIVEVYLREYKKFKYKIKAPEFDLEQIIHDPGIKIILRTRQYDLKQSIEGFVKEFIQEKNRTVVTVNVRNLSRIREEAQETLETLVIPDIISSNFGWEENALIAENFSNKEDSSDEENYEYEEEVEEEQRGTTVQSAESDEQMEDEWTLLKLSFTTAELQALRILLSQENLQQYALDCGIMMEVLVDSINEKASDIIGDLILDEEMLIYEDYVEQVQGML